MSRYHSSKSSSQRRKSTPSSEGNGMKVIIDCFLVAADLALIVYDMIQLGEILA